MDEQDFRILITLAETGNLTKTAERLFMAQPTLTKRLQNIENDLGAILFLRSKQGITLTPMGEKTIESVREIAGSVEACVRSFIRAVTLWAAHCRWRYRWIIHAIACLRYWRSIRISIRM